MNKKYLIEVCVDSVESAIAAENGGADRLEICSNLIIGGTTPSLGLYTEIDRYVRLPKRVLIRPRCGDFLYSSYELDVMLKEVEQFHQLGAEGIVVGCLNEDGYVDQRKLMKLIEKSKEMKITFHRAFDMARDILKTYEVLSKMNIDTILTSGQKANCLLGMENIKALLQHTDNAVNILVGGGVNTAVIQQYLEDTDVTQFHLSGKTIMDSGMIYRKNDVHMGADNFLEYSIYRTDERYIREVKELISKN